MLKLKEHLRHRVILQLGSNLGDKRALLKDACSEISKFHNIVKLGSIYETASWGRTNLPSFYNQILEIETSFDPFSLLIDISEIELRMGREREIKWDSRCIDIDIIFYSKKIIWTKTLSIPHPFLQSRRFVLEPLAEHWKDYYHPYLKKDVDELLSECDDLLPVTRLKE